MCLNTFVNFWNTLTVIPVSKNRNYFCFYGLIALFDLDSVLFLPSPFQSLLEAIRFSIRSSWQFERDVMILKILQVWHSRGYGIHYFYGVSTSYFVILTKLKIQVTMTFYYSMMVFYIYVIKTYQITVSECSRSINLITNQYYSQFFYLYVRSMC